MTIRTMALGAAVLASTFGSTAMADVEIRASSWHPPRHPVVVGGFEPYLAAVKEASDGKIDFTFWAGGALMGATETLPGVEDGSIDIGVLALTYFPAEFPHAQLIADLGMLSADPMAVAAAVTELVVHECAPCQKDFTDKGIIFTSAYSTTPYTLISKEPIETLADLRGKKFRSAGPLWDRWVQSVGGTSIVVPASEMFESLDRGGVDVAIFSPSALSSFSLWDVARYNVLLPVGNYAAMSTFTLNQDFWRDLTPEDRRTLLDSMAMGNMGITYAYVDQDESALIGAEEKGVAIVEPSAELTAQLETFREADVANVAEQAEKNYGIADASEIIATYRRLLAKWEGLSAEAAGDRDAFTAMVKREIYDRIDAETFGL